MSSIFINKNISQALEYLKNKGSQDQIYFVISQNQKHVRINAEREDFLFIKSLYSDTKEILFKDIQTYSKEDDCFFGWDSFDELKLCKKNNLKLGSQNRLLDSFELEKIKSFTPFRKIVEKNLPKRFEENIHQEQDEDVLKNLSYYFEQNHLAKKYFEIRNGVVGRDYSTKFSRYLSSGRLNVRYLYNYIKDYEDKFGSNKSTYWLVFELLWREFFYWSYQKYQEKYFSLGGLQHDLSFKRELPELDTSLFKNDSFMKAVCNELTQTGFVSNRLRQVFASCLINSYQLDWRIGANFFEQYLIDYDVYSNWGNWQYLAGVGHDPKGLRIFNVNKQLEQYDPEGEYLKKWL